MSKWQRIKGKESIRFVNTNLPLPTEKYIYTEDTCEYLTQGEVYSVIRTGEHWWSYLQGLRETGVWVTTDDYPNTTDEDYGVFFSMEELKNEFSKV